MDENYLEYDDNANINNSNLCITPVILGCTDINAINYDPFANVDDDSCIEVVLGCTDEYADNYNSLANTEALILEYGLNNELIEYQSSGFSSYTKVP